MDKTSCQTHPWQEVLARAVDAFPTHILTTQDLVLKLGMKTLSGEVSWTPIRPEQWTTIVCDGDEIRVGYTGAEADGVHLDSPSPVVIFTYESSSTGTHRAHILLPKSYRVSHSWIGREVFLDWQFNFITEGCPSYCSQAVFSSRTGIKWLGCYYNSENFARHSRVRTNQNYSFAMVSCHLPNA